jgi:hypothetical protein
MEIDERLPKLVMTDEARLCQILINLISNAIKFTANGFVKVKVSYFPDFSTVPREDKNREPEKVWLDKGVVNYLCFKKVTNFNSSIDFDDIEEQY